MMNKAKLGEYLNIVTLGAWTGVFISVIFLDLNAHALREIAGGASFVVTLDLFLDTLSNRKQRIKRKIMLEYMANEFKYDNDKQGNK